jgi:hypothetical protein
MFNPTLQNFLFAALSAALLLPLPVNSQEFAQPLADMESRAFGQPQSSLTNENRVSALEQKAYGKVHVGALPLRIAALQYYFGIQSAPPQPAMNTRLPRPTDVPGAAEGTKNTVLDAAQNSAQSSPSDATIANGQRLEKPPLQAGVTETQMQMQAGDDERFGGLWVGTLGSRIDPHVNVFCELHGSGKHFTGTMIWTSKICGGCRRTIIGYFDPKDQACMMKDLSVEPLDPANKAGFCRVDRYAFGLTENATRLSGWFKANLCKDAGPVTLYRYRYRTQ